MGISLDLGELAEKNYGRLLLWHGPGIVAWTGADWSNAMQGEAGEAGNVVKKLRRHETGTNTARDPSINALLVMLAEELADTIIYADLVARYYQIDLAAAIIEKFNRVSEREGYPQLVQRDWWLKTKYRDLLTHHLVTKGQVPCDGCSHCA